MTEIVQLPPQAAGDHPALLRAGAILRGGGLVAFPTETVYGLGADGLNATAVAGIFAAKGRPADNPLILHLASPDALETVAVDPPRSSRLLAEAFWPGPLTMVLRRRENVPEIVSAGRQTVAVRVPAHPLALALIAAAGRPIAAPSANLSGRPSPTTAQHVLDDLAGRIDLIIDGGPTPVGLESTVLDLTADEPKLLRPGGIGLEELQAVLSKVGVDLDRSDLEQPKAPGMKYRHYAPEAPLTVVSGTAAEIAAYARRALEMATGQGRRLAVLVHTETAALLPIRLRDAVMDLGPRRQPEIAANRLFSFLRACDEEGYDAILAEEAEGKGLGRAVNNRLLKAAGGRRIRAREANII